MEEQNIFQKNSKLIAIVVFGLVLISVVISFATSRSIVPLKKSTLTPTPVKSSFSKMFDNNPKPIEINNFSLKLRSDGDFVFNSVAIPKFDVGKRIPLVLYSNSNSQAVSSFSASLVYDASRVKYFFTATKNDKSPWNITVKNEDGKLLITGVKKEGVEKIIFKETPLVDMSFETVKSGPISFFFDNDEEISYIYNYTGQNILKNAVGLSLIIR